MTRVAGKKSLTRTPLHSGGMSVFTNPQRSSGDFVGFWMAANGYAPQLRSHFTELYEAILEADRLICLYTRPTFSLQLTLLSRKGSQEPVSLFTLHSFLEERRCRALTELKEQRATLLKLLGIRLRSDRPPPNANGADTIGTFCFKNTSNRQCLAAFRPNRWINFGLATAKWTVIAVAAWQTYRLVPWPLVQREALRLFYDLVAFEKKWVWEPLVSIWHTVRYRGNTLTILSDQNAIQSDMDALNRMLSSYSHKKGISADGAASMGLVLNVYETELKHPLRAALFGDLVRLLLIQVQRSKVDLEQAMLALDRLLRSNELTFELLAIVPLLGLSTWMGRGIASLCHWYLREKQRRRNVYSLRKALRALDRLVIESNSELTCDPVLFLRYGEVFEFIHSQPLQRCTSESRDAFRELNEDLGVLLKCSESRKARWTLQRMQSLTEFI